MTQDERGGIVFPNFLQDEERIEFSAKEKILEARNIYKDKKARNKSSWNMSPNQPPWGGVLILIPAT